MKTAGIDYNLDNLEIEFGEKTTNNQIEFTVKTITKIYLDEQKLDIKNEKLKEQLKSSFDEIKKLRNELDSVNKDDFNKIINELMNKTDELDKLINKTQIKKDEFEEEISLINSQIKNIDKEIKESNKKYNESYDKLKNLIIEQNELLDNSNLLSEEEYNKLTEEFLEKKINENNITANIKNTINLRKKELSNLKRKLNKLKKDMETANALGITSKEYKDITDTLQKRKIMNAILEEKGLSEIITKSAKDRTKEEKKQLSDAKKEIEEEIAKAMKDNNNHVLETIDVLYHLDTKAIMKNKSRKAKYTKEEIDNIINTVNKLPEKVTKPDNIIKDYEPEKAPIDMINNIKDDDTIKNEIKDEIINKDKITFIKDKNSHLYGDKETIIRFTIDPLDKEYNYDRKTYYLIKDTDADYILNNKDNKYSPYDIEYINEWELDNYIDNKNDEKELDEIKFYIDNKDNNITYVNKDILKRFNLEAIGKDEKINNEYYYPISKNDAKYILGNANNKYSPYKVNTEEVEIDKKSIVELEPNPDKLLEREEVASGELIVGEEDIYDLIKRNHNLDIRDNPDYEIGYDGVMDNNGLSESQKTRYIVFKKVNKNEKETNNEKEDTIENQELEERNPQEIITLFRDINDDNQIYVRKNTMLRFTLESIGNERRIKDSLCYPISENDAIYIIGNADNNYSPYLIKIVDAELEKEKENDELHEEVETDEKIDTIILYRNQDENGKTYVDKETLERFSLTPDGEKNEEYDLYPIDEIDSRYIVANQNNIDNPYIIEFRDIHLGKRIEQEENDKEVSPIIIEDDTETPTDASEDENTDENESDNNNEDENTDENTSDNNDEDEDEDVDIDDIRAAVSDDEEIPEEEIIIYRDTDDDNQLYVRKSDAFNKLHIITSGGTTNINGEECVKVEDNIEDYIHNTAEKLRRVKYNVRYVDVQLNRRDTIDDPERSTIEDPTRTTREPSREGTRPHVEGIIYKLTEGLDIGSKDAKRYNASNIKISKTFAEELHSGNYAYNIVHFVPSLLKAGINFFRKLSGKLLTTKKAKETIETIKDRLNNLTEEELEVLFNEYKGTKLKTDMNNQINSLILDRLKRYGLEKVAELNEIIKNDYSRLFVIARQIDALSERLQNTGLSRAERDSINAELDRLYLTGSECVKEIENYRKEANNILSSGIHGLEEDFKAVATKMNYVGFRFSKSHNFNNELQEKLARYEDELYEGLDTDNPEKIVQGFFKLESTYYANTHIDGSIVGKRSTGEKYFSPLAEEFNYNDDPFIRDLLTTAAVTTAAVSAVNGIRVHKYAEEQLNVDNSKFVEEVHRAGREITSKSDRFKAGMQAQAEQDVINAANTRERLQLDMTGWKFTDAYHEADAAGHQMYNVFSDTVTQGINRISQEYSLGRITQDEALRQVSNLASYSQQQLVSVVNEGLTMIRKYASTHPQFDLHAYEDAMSYVVSNPNAIIDMNNAMGEVIEIGERLQTFTLPQQQLIASLPSDLSTTLICAASSVCLATNIADKMNKKYAKRVTYGNEITDMFDRYSEGIDEYDAYEEEETRTR